MQACAFRFLPLGTVRPLGWLESQLRVQADGLTGHLDEFWPSVRDSRWIGGEAEGWERGPYWLDGLIPLAFLRGDEKLKAKAQQWVDAILEHQHEDGWLGAKDDDHEGEGDSQLDPWPLFVVFKAFLQWHETTGDERIVPALLRCARRIEALLQQQPLRSWAKMRWADFVWTLQELYELTGEEWLLDLASMSEKQGYDWASHFADLPFQAKTRHDQLGREVALPLHGVNNAMGLKSGPVYWRQCGFEAQKQNALRGLEQLDRYHGAPSGMFTADEHLAGLSPVQGFETCAVVEMMFSLEVAGAITGQAALFDRLEQVTFNALPASTTPDFWAHQYHQQTNQVLCSVARRDWTDSGPRTNLFGQDVNFGCCQANLHQGWPKFAASLWMRTPGDGFAAAAYAPCRVEALVNGVPVVMTETTNYPFDGEVTLRIECEKPVTFPLQLRIPGWAKHASLVIADEEHTPEAHDGWAFIEREWQYGDEVTLKLSMPVRAESHGNNTVSLHRGPLLLALQMQEEFRPSGSPYVEEQPKAQEWEVFPVSHWNFALAMGKLTSGQNELSPFVEQLQSPADLPFDPATPPVLVQVPAKRIGWELVNHSAAPPESATEVQSEIEIVNLVPYGSTHLRIAVFPTVE